MIVIDSVFIPFLTFIWDRFLFLVFRIKVYGVKIVIFATECVDIGIRAGGVKLRIF